MSSPLVARPPTSSARKRQLAQDPSKPVLPSPSSASSAIPSPVTPAIRRPPGSKSNPTSASSSSSKNKPGSAGAKQDLKRPRFFSPPRIPAYGRAQSADPLEGDVFDADQDPIGMDDINQSPLGQQNEVKLEDHDRHPALEVDDDGPADSQDPLAPSQPGEQSASDMDADDEEDADAGGSDYDAGNRPNASPTRPRPSTRTTKATDADDPASHPPSNTSRPLQNGSSSKRKRRAAARPSVVESASESGSPVRPVVALVRRAPPAKPAFVSTQAATPTSKAGLSSRASGSRAAGQPAAEGDGPAGGPAGGSSRKKAKSNGHSQSSGKAAEKDIGKDKAIAELGLADVWDDLSFTIDSLLNDALDGFRQLISRRIVTAMSYPTLSLPLDDPSLATFVAPFVDKLRPAIVQSLLDRLASIEEQRRPAPSKTSSTAFQDQDYDALVYGPVRALLDATTARLQQTAFAEVLRNFPAILGDQPRDELKKLVAKGAGNVRKNVKDGIRLWLEQEASRS